MTNMSVLQSPPRHGWRRYVSLEFLHPPRHAVIGGEEGPGGLCVCVLGGRGGVGMAQPGPTTDVAPQDRERERVGSARTAQHAPAREQVRAADGLRGRAAAAGERSGTVEQRT